MTTCFLTLHYIPYMLESAELESRSGFYISLLIFALWRLKSITKPLDDPGSSQLQVCPPSTFGSVQLNAWISEDNRSLLSLILKLLVSDEYFLQKVLNKI